MESKGCAFLMDMGTGKTITTIAVAGAMYQTGRVKKLLVRSCLTTMTSLICTTVIWSMWKALWKASVAG